MGTAGSARARIAQRLNAAYGVGLISDATLSHRLDALFSGGLVEPRSLVGDISRRPARRGLAASVRRLTAAARSLRVAVTREPREPPMLLALDWHVGSDELVLGRHPRCDFQLASPSASRRHAALRFRDGSWTLQDLGSRNGTRVNGELVQRCELRPGDVLELGGQRIELD
ncbi:MAG: FHA domain-containing protein [Solirubrobacteraceae bacterium]